MHTLKKNLCIPKVTEMLSFVSFRQICQLTFYTSIYIHEIDFCMWCVRKLININFLFPYGKFMVTSENSSKFSDSKGQGLTL